MLGQTNVVAFVIITDAERAKKFYAETLGLTFVSQDQFAVVFRANGIMLRLTPMPNHKPLQSTVLGWEVTDIGTTARALAEAGVTFERYSFLEQNDFGVWVAPDSKAKVAWFKDPDGNVLSISEHQ